MDACETIPLVDGVVHLGQQRIVGRAEVVHLTSMECRVLAYLAARAGEIVPREDLLVDVWQYRPTAITRAVDNMIRKLRAKLERNPREPDHIFTVHGTGYRFEPGEKVVAEVMEPAVTTSLAVTNLEDTGEPFIGREALQGHVRATVSARPIVVLTGPSGIGKTRLACEVAMALCDEGVFESVWLLELADVRSRAGWQRALATLLLEPGVTGNIEVLGAALERRGRTLLVLDNLEQLEGAANEDLRFLAQSAPQAAFLLTSQRRLKMKREVVIKLPPLPVDEACALFVTRARDAGVLAWDAEPSREDLAHLVTILDGHPLAIELAAACHDLLGIRDLAARQAEHLDLLEQDHDKGEARHRTLRATVAWSWSLLSETEARALAACSVFTGGFSDTLVLELWKEMGIPSASLRLLQNLVDRSLIAVRTTPPPLEARRFHLYSPVKLFAAERLAEDARGRALRQAHCAVMATIADAAYRDCDVSALVSIEENLTSAYATAMAEERADCVPLALATRALTEHATRAQVALTRLEEVLQTHPTHPRRRELAIARAGVLTLLGDWEASWQISDALLGDIETAEPPVRARHVLQRCELLRNASRMEEASSLISDTLDRDGPQLSMPLRCSLERALANIHLHVGRARDAQQVLAGILDEAEGLPVAMQRGLLQSRATSCILLGELEEASRLLGELATLSGSRGFQFANQLCTRSWCLAELGYTEDAVVLARQGVAAAKECGPPAFEAFARGRLAHALMESEDAVAFKVCCEAVIDAYTELGEPARRALAYLNKNLACQRLGDLVGAREAVARAMVDFGESRSRVSAYGWLHESILLAPEDVSRARRSLHIAREILAECGAGADQRLLELAALHLQVSGSCSAEELQQVGRRVDQIFLNATTAHSADVRVVAKLLQERLARLGGRVGAARAR